MEDAAGRAHVGAAPPRHRERRRAEAPGAATEDEASDSEGTHQPPAAGLGRPTRGSKRKPGWLAGYEEEQEEEEELLGEEEVLGEEEEQAAHAPKRCRGGGHGRRAGGRSRGSSGRLRAAGAPGRINGKVVNDQLTEQLQKIAANADKAIG